MDFICFVLMVLNIITFIASVIFMILGIYEWLMGADGLERLLQKLPIPIRYKTTLIVGFTCLGICIITYIAILKIKGWM